MATLEEQFDRHEDRDDERFEKIGETLSEIRSNHLSHIETDMAWLKWIGMGLIAGVLSIISKLFLKI